MKFKLRRYYLYYLGRTVAFLVFIIPLKAGRVLADILGSICFRILGKYRRVAVDNLTSVFGAEKSPTEIRKIAESVFRNVVRGGVELVNFPKINRSNIDRFVRIRGIEIVDGAFRKGKGAIILTAHFGNWELVGATFRVKGYPGVVIVKRIYFSKYDAFLNRLRKVHDVNVIYRDQSPKSMLRILRNNQILGILADQDVDSVGGVFVNFFGRNAYTPIGPAALAKASGADLIPVFMIRDGTRYTMQIEKPIELTDTGDKEKDMVTNTQKWTDVLETYIRKYPYQWVWMHRRWKTIKVKSEK
ncbi:MAG: lysophospholipid acyltransferase family protein [Candidatus Omnitrophica bacterium]|nr:lysophospholipid acyltransferase family protein [Candidatus Omnitrophota bacterium]